MTKMRRYSDRVLGSCLEIARDCTSGLCAASDVGTPRGGSIRIQHVTAGAAAAASTSSLPGLQGGSGPPSLASAGPCPDGDAPVRFPRLDECAHFHYDHVELGPLQVRLYEEELKALQEETSEGGEGGDDSPPLCVQVTSAGRAWLLRRAPRDFRSLDAQLHRCVWDRKFSALPDLSIALQTTEQESSEECARRVLSAYLCRFSSLAGSLINCGPVLSWLELDNRGRRLIVTEDNAINTPAVAAAYAVRRYVAQAADEISFEVGDMISVIDMPPPQESIWWRGKRGFEVGFFPCDTVAVIGDKVPKNLHLSAAPSAPPSGTVCGGGASSAVVPAPLSMASVTSAAHLPNKPVLRKHGKLIAFFRSFILNRPSRRRLKQSGILKERVFGCDLGEHLLNSGHEIPMVLKCCSEFIESSGIVDGIYRLSGVTSNIQKLRNAFDEDRIPALYEDESILQDIHSVASLLKMYFRELPNPLCTYQLYPSFVAAVQARENERLIKMREAVQKLPPPHYRTLEYLIRHLARVASRGHETGMTPRNVAIVWAPNLLRCKELEVGGLGALQGVGVQAVVTEFLVCCCDLIFCDSLPAETDTPAISEQAVSTLRRGGARPKSLAISTPTKLLSLEEARSRALGQPGQEFIEVGGGPSQLPGKYHTVIELPSGRKRGSSLKAKRSPLGWRSLFGGGGKARPASKQRKSSTPTDMEQSALQSEVLQPRRPLRPVKSAESLGSSGGGSQHNSARNSAALELDSVSPGALGVAQTSPESPGSIAGPLPCISLHTSFLPVKPSHNRSVSHDSYFDLLSSSQRGDDDDDDITEEGSLDLSEIQLNFELEESEMRIFSEDETLVSTSSPATSNHSVLSHQAGRHKPSPRNVPRARMEELSMSSADPSPKKNKKSSTNSPGSRKRSRTITPHSVKVDELRFIDSQSPEPNNGTMVTSAEVHESPPSDISAVCGTVLENESFALPRSSGSSGLTTPGSPPRYAPLLSEQPSPLTAATTPATTLPPDTGTSLEGLYENIASGDWEQITPGTNLLYQNVMPISPKSQKEENVYEDVQPPSTRSAEPQVSPLSAEAPAVDPEEVYQQVRAFRRSVAEVNDLMFRSGGMPSSPSNSQHETELRKSWSPALAPQDSEELRRRFDSEIGRDIVRERRMKTELARVRADSTPTSPTQSPAHDRVSSSQLSPPSSMACVTSEGVTDGDVSPLATTAAPLLPSSEGSLTSLSSASFDPLSPSPPLHHNLPHLSKPQLGTSPSPLSLSSPSPGSSRNSPSKRSSSIGSPEKVTCNLINLESQSPKYRLSDSNFSSQQISPDSDGSDRNKRHSFNPHILEKVTCSLVNIETRSSPKYLVSSGNMSSSQISSIDSESSNLDSLSPTTQDSEITLLSPMMSPIKENMKLMLSPILSSEEFSESPEFSSQRIQAPSTLNISKPVSPDEDTSLDLSRLQESPTVTDSLRDTPTSFTCSPDLPLTPSLSIRPGPPSRPLTPLLSSPDQRSVSTKSSPISPEPLSNRSPTLQLQDSSPKSETLPNLWDENSSGTLSAKSTELRSSESPLENEDDDDDVELRNPNSETSRPKSAPSKASTVRVHVTLTSRRSSEPIKTLSLADARRLGNRKASVKELLNQFESGSPQQKSMPPCLRAKVAKNQLASAMSGSLDEERFNEHARDLVRVQTSPDVTKQEDDADENDKIESQPDSKHDDNIPKVNIAKNLLSDVNLNDPIRRERIEKYKEERRNFLREKYRSESFRVDKQKDDIVSRLKQKTSKAGGGCSTSENSDTMMSRSVSDNERLNEGIRSRSQSESSSRPKLKQPTSPTHSLKDNMGALFETNENQKPKSPEYFSSV